MHCRSDAASPAQAPGCCGGILPRSIFSSKFFEKIRPRHFRKFVYQSRLHEGNVAVAEARKLFNAFQRSLSHDTWRRFENELFRLEEERQRFRPFADYHHLHAAQTEATWCMECIINCTAGSKLKAERTITNAGIMHLTFSSLTPERELESPLQTVQTRAAPIAWTPSPSHNALDLVLGPPQIRMDRLGHLLAESGRPVDVLLPSVWQLEGDTLWHSIHPKPSEQELKLPPLHKHPFCDRFATSNGVTNVVLASVNLGHLASRRQRPCWIGSLSSEPSTEAARGCG
ncbi:hypothetical protein ONZ51_g7893 [Trametes cubensis]|uniref:Uncharacterized protein n=1 Tax=Trametes cubensis TaxID=1111947 RepID=A0AAD7XBB1_9APHY|nr:hypothetical protein ONZ51_g7893 [Trametes cubensis]